MKRNPEKDEHSHLEILLNLFFDSLCGFARHTCFVNRLPTTWAEDYVKQLFAEILDGKFDDIDPLLQQLITTRQELLIKLFKHLKEKIKSDKQGDC